MVVVVPEGEDYPMRQTTKSDNGEEYTYPPKLLCYPMKQTTESDVVENVLFVQYCYEFRGRDAGLFLYNRALDGGGRHRW